LSKCPLAGPFLMFKAAAGSVNRTVNGTPYTLQSADSLEANLLGINSNGVTGYNNFNSMFSDCDTTLLDEQNTIMAGSLQPPDTMEHFRGFARPVIALAGTQSPFKTLSYYEKTLRYAVDFTLTRKIGYDLLVEATFLIPLQKQTVGENTTLQVIKSVLVNTTIPAGNISHRLTHTVQLESNEESTDYTKVSFADKPATRYKGPHLITCTLGETQDKPKLAVLGELVETGDTDTQRVYWQIQADIPAPGQIIVSVRHKENNRLTHIDEFALEQGQKLSNVVTWDYPKESFAYGVSVEILPQSDYDLATFGYIRPLTIRGRG
jgi:hypothetical protein